ncbi:hypothetical protein [Motilimonas pumila]|uniref:Uncharacterized protein n=1 Tax=Motilimonas pumila TaxID=2303987 RepID=A0A418YKU2_9GAMM|nr:hypothetical protein [Motilimonas pumila]RJG51593.1 hypothetical protein D1Z90_02365 [Motilimonas pumila]
MQGAGGTQGGIGSFFIGLIMLISGGYLLLNAIIVSHHFHLGMSLYSFGGFSLTSGMVLVPFIFGIGIIFYNYKNWLGWLLTLGGLTMLFFGVISSISMRLKTMTSFELITILVLLIGGLGLFLRSLKQAK